MDRDVPEVYQPAEDSLLLAETATERVGGDDTVLEVGVGSGFVAERVRSEVTVIGVGGVFTAADAYRKLRAGADLVQLYTGLVYRGPAVARDINEGLLALLERDGFDSAAEAVGADLDRAASEG